MLITRSSLRRGRRYLSMLLTIAIVLSSFAPAAVASSSGAGGAVEGVTYFVDHDNWGGPGSTGIDGDLDIGIKNQNNSPADNYDKFPIEFKFDVDKPVPGDAEAYLLIRAYDVDEEDGNYNDSTNGEWDRVYFSSNPEHIRMNQRYTQWKYPIPGANIPNNGYMNEMHQDAYVGALSGSDTKWNTTVLPIEAGKIVQGENYVGITIHHYHQDPSNPNSNWQMTVDWGQLVINGGSRSKGEITYASLEPGSVNNELIVNTEFMPKVNGDFSIEVSLIEKATIGGDVVDQNLAIGQKRIRGGQANTLNNNEIVLKDVRLDPNKEYTLNVILYEDGGALTESPKDVNNTPISIDIDPMEVQHIYTMSTFDPKVEDIELNNRPQYEPTWFSLNDFEDKLFKINGRQDNTLEKVKIVTLPDPSTGRLVFGQDDVAAGDELNAAELGNLRFIPTASGGFNQPVTFEWNGYDQDKKKYAQFNAEVVISPNLAPVLDNVNIPVNKGTTAVPVGDGINRAVQDDQAPLQPDHVAVLSLPSTGTLMLGQTAVTQGMEIPWAQLPALTYVPESANQTGTVTFSWNASDGLQYAKDPATVTITINHPPVALDVVKTGLEGRPVVIPAVEFKMTDADGDDLKLIDIVNVDPSIGKLQYTTVTDGTYRDIAGPIDYATLASVIFTPAADLPLYPPVVTQWRAQDGKQFSEQPGSITITYDGRPIAHPQIIEAEEGSGVIPVILTGEDAESAVLAYDIISQPAKGTLEPSANGSQHWIYRPDPSFVGGKDSFRFTVTDDVYHQSSEPAEVTIVINRTLDGWVGDQQQGDNEVVTAIPGKPLALNAVSSLHAQKVNAIVNGVVVPLTEVNPAGAEAAGYRTWSNSHCIMALGIAPGNCVLPMDTAAGLHLVTFEAFNGAGQSLPAEMKLQDNQFKVVGTNLTLLAKPESIPGDGKSTTELTAVVKDGDGKPVEGVAVTFEAPAGQGEFVGPHTAVTDQDGKAVVVFRSPKISGVNNETIEVTATVDEPARGLYGKDNIQITFQPAVVRGMITEGESHRPVAHTPIRITLDLNGDGIIEAGVDFIATVVTDEHGAYSLPVPKGDATYNVEFTREVMIGGVPTPVTYAQKARVDKIAGNSEVFDSEKTVTGMVLFQKSNGLTSLLNNSMIDNMKVYLKDENGVYITDASGSKKPFELGKQGVFTADGLEAGQKYVLEVWYEMEIYDEHGPTGKYKEIAINGKRDPQNPDVIRYPEIALKANGEVNLVQDLVDPYGTISDGHTQLPIEGADVTLYYANTARNKANGVTPDTKVYLPPLPGFEPNNNESPSQKSDSKGFYAYMVYPETDYYLVVRKDGYNSYTSQTISVEWDIVKHDVKLYRPASGDVSSPAQPGSSPQQPAVSLDLAVDSNLVQEGSESKLRVWYKNEAASPLQGGVITITLPDGTEVIDAQGGQVEGNTISWSIGRLAGQQSGEFIVTLKWPQLDSKEAVFDIKGSFTANGQGASEARGSLKIQVFSTRYESLSHQRYILGYPDGEFKPNRSLTRAELAAIVARLTENSVLDTPIAYSDVPSDYWAANYIRIATKHGYFNGFADGTFRPDVQVTRGELAMVMTRFLDLEVSQSGEMHFNDIDGHWASDAIEALYRNKFLSGYPDGSFKPRNSIIRSEAVTMINRMLYRGPLQGLEPLFPDMPKSHWAFGDVQEATISHESVRQADGSEQWIRNIADDVK